MKDDQNESSDSDENGDHSCCDENPDCGFVNVSLDHSWVNPDEVVQGHLKWENIRLQILKGNLQVESFY